MTMTMMMMMMMTAATSGGGEHRRLFPLNIVRWIHLPSCVSLRISSSN
jgi:hypothetical protein